MEGYELVLAHGKKDGVILLVNIELSRFEVSWEFLDRGVGLNQTHILGLLVFAANLDFVVIISSLKLLDLFVH